MRIAPDGVAGPSSQNRLSQTRCGCEDADEKRLKLLADYEVLEEEMAPATQAPWDPGQQGSEEYEHHLTIADLRITTRRHSRTDLPSHAPTARTAGADPG